MQGWQWPFALYGLAFPILLLGVFYLWEPERRAKEEVVVTGQPFPWAIATVICAVTLGMATLYFVQVLQFSLVLSEIGVSDQAQIGRISGLASLGVPVGALVFKRIAKRPMNSRAGLGAIRIRKPFDSRACASRQRATYETRATRHASADVE